MWICLCIPSTDQSTGKSRQLLTAVESVKQDLHKLDQYQATVMMDVPPMPPMEVIFQPSMAIVQATKIQPSTVIKNPQIWTTRIFISASQFLSGFPTLRLLFPQSPIFCPLAEFLCLFFFFICPQIVVPYSCRDGVHPGSSISFHPRSNWIMSGPLIKQLFTDSWDNKWIGENQWTRVVFTCRWETAVTLVPMSHNEMLWDLNLTKSAHPSTYLKLQKTPCKHSILSLIYIHMSHIMWLNIFNINFF